MAEKIIVSEAEAKQVHNYQELLKRTGLTKEEIIKALEKDPNALKPVLCSFYENDVNIIRDADEIALLVNTYKAWQLEVLDTLNENAESVLVMLPGIVPNYPYSDASAYIRNWELVGLESYDGKSPFTYTLAELVWEKDRKWESRIIQFNYPMKNEEGIFGIQSFMKQVQAYLTDIPNFQEKWISVYGSSMWWKTAIYTAWKVLESGWKLENLVLYALAISADLLVPPTNLLDKVPADLATAFQKLIALPFIDWQIKNSYKKDWWIELSKEDLQKLWKAVWGYDVSWQQMKARLKFIASNIEYDFNFLRSVDAINKSWANIIVLTSDIWNGTDGALVNSKIEEKIKQLFPELNIKFVNIEWLPHVNVPQAANLHKKILEKNL